MMIFLKNLIITHLTFLVNILSVKLLHYLWYVILQFNKLVSRNLFLIFLNYNRILDRHLLILSSVLLISLPSMQEVYICIKICANILNHVSQDSMLPDVMSLLRRIRSFQIHLQLIMMQNVHNFCWPRFTCCRYLRYENR